MAKLGIMLPLSVNVSLLLLHHDRGTEMLTLLDRYRIAPGTLVLEITESRHLDDPQTVVSLRARYVRPACGSRWMISVWATPGCVSSSI